MKPSADAIEDDYEPPPHSLVQLWSGLVRLRPRAFPQPTNWRRVWYAFVLALTDLFLAQRVFRYLPWRFQADGRRYLWVSFDLYESARKDMGEFLQRVAWYGGDIVLLTPVLEEVLLRGFPILLARFALRRLPTRAGRMVAIAIAVASTLLFAWLHNPVVGFMPVSHLFFGAVAWILAWRWGLRYSVLFHFFVNGLIFAKTIQWVMMLPAR